DHLCHKPKECDGGKRCRHRLCVNPEHLKPATAAENNRRGNAAKLTTKKVVKIRELFSEGKNSEIEIARKFSISYACVSMIVTGRRWKDVGGPIAIRLPGRRRVRTGITDEKLKLILSLRLQGFYYWQIAEKTGVSRTHVCRITKRSVI
ncbi:MAG TPA: hypothetical protein VMW38_24980, partial [Terriglobia bacterium]|nr:hypothetical protein [Terriglobia bacterium]